MSSRIKATRNFDVTLSPSVKLCECGCGEPAPVSPVNHRRRGYVKGQPMRFISGHSSRVDNPNRIKEPMEPLNPSGLCMCGCGSPAPLAQKSCRKRGYIQGQPVRYLPNHHPTKTTTPGRRGQRSLHKSTGYVMVYLPEHPNAGRNGYVAEHVLIASRVLGKPLPGGAHVHHVNKDRSDNRNANLVIVPDTAYHNLLHRRLDALNACGNPDWRKCTYCKEYDDPARMVIEDEASRGYHRECKKTFYREYRERRVA